MNSRIRALDGVNFVPSEEHASCLISSTYWKGSVLMIDPRDVSEAEASDAERSSYVPAAGKAVMILC